MASVISKKINGKIYYYLAVSARVGGKPRIVEQRRRWPGRRPCRPARSTWRSGISRRPGG
ncbi:MAG: hypothetical protein LC700_03365 [Actinobacteria bacterium]|nr:hypothetical protein [Actinomycetota bacterium]